MYSSLCTEEIQNFFSGSLLHLTLAFFCHTNPLHVLFHYIHVIFFYSFNQNMKSVFTLINFFQNFCYTNTNVFYHRDVKEYTVCSLWTEKSLCFRIQRPLKKFHCLESSSEVHPWAAFCSLACYKLFSFYYYSHSSLKNEIASSIKAILAA